MSDPDCNEVGACAAKGTLPPPGWTETDTSVEAVFSPTTVDLGGGVFGCRIGDHN